MKIFGEPRFCKILFGMLKCFYELINYLQMVCIDKFFSYCIFDRFYVNIILFRIIVNVLNMLLI